MRGRYLGWLPLLHLLETQHHSRCFIPQNTRLVQIDQPKDVIILVIELNPLATGDNDDSDRTAHEATPNVGAVPNQNRGVGDRELGVGEAEFRECVGDDLMNLALGTQGTVDTCRQVSPCRNGSSRS